MVHIRIIICYGTHPFRAESVLFLHVIGDLLCGSSGRECAGQAHDDHIALLLAIFVDVAMHLFEGMMC